MYDCSTFVTALNQLQILEFINFFLICYTIRFNLLATYLTIYLYYY